MPRTPNHSSAPANRIGAYGFTLLMAFGGLNAVGGTSPAGTATIPAQRLQAPTAVVVVDVAPPAAENVAAVVVELTNQARAAAGLAPVTEEAHITAAAVAHSADQAATRVMSHTGSDGSNAGARITAAGFTWRAWGENVAGGQKTAAIVVAAWMNSPGHRANILNPAYTRIGIGSVASVDGILFWTMDLAA